MNFIASIIFIFSSLSFAQNQWASVYQKSVSRIPIVVSGGVVCSGALIESDLVATASHCVDRLYPIAVYFKSTPVISAQLLTFSRGLDLAIIKLGVKLNIEPLTIMSDAERNSEGSSITTIGHPVGQGNFTMQSVLKSQYTYVMSAGLISKVNDDGYVSDMSVSPGNSGGPVFNSRGEIVGIVSKKRIDRFVGQLNYVSSHNSLHRLLKQLKEKGPVQKSIVNASTNFDVYVMYATPSFRKNAKGDSKSYLNLGGAIDFWDRLRLFVDTNLDSEEILTQYGIGWNFYIQGSDPLHSYRIIPTVETIKFQWEDTNKKEVRKQTIAIGLTLKSSWFPFFVKASRYEIGKKQYSLLGLGLAF